MRGRASQSQSVALDQDGLDSQWTGWKRSRHWRGEVKRIGDLADGEIALWRQLAATRPPLRSPFFSYEFARAVAESGALARVCLLYRGGELAGFFPFQFSNAFTKALAAAERIGGPLNEFSGLIIDASRHGPIDNSELLWCARLVSFEVSHLEETQRTIGLRVSAERQGARIKIAQELNTYWADVQARHPRYYGRFSAQERRAERDFRSIEFKFFHPEPSKILPLIVAEKRKQYQRTGKADGFAEPWKPRCLEYIARYGGGRCSPVVSALYFDGEWAALNFSVRAGAVLNTWFPVYNRKFDKFSPGLILLSRMIREAGSQGIDEIELGEGVSQYKSLFATEVYPVYSDLWQRFTPRGLAYRGYLSTLWRFRKMRK